MMALDLKELVEHTVRTMVDDPSQVQVDVVEGTDKTTYEVHVAPGDVGRMIGRQGRTINALRTVLRAAGRRLGKRVTVEIIT
jgi:predicted RNA-binding protein YlqC (UPF0109 family)